MWSNSYTKTNQKSVDADMNNEQYYSLLRLIEEMRSHQKRFFSMAKDDPERVGVMRAARNLERQVDGIIQRELSPELFP